MNYLYRLARHIGEHPYRLLTTISILMLVTLVLSIFSVYQSVRASHKAAHIVCQQLNEFRIEAYTMAIDLGAPEHLASRLITQSDCETLP
jgi:hypothetical protein